jgi:hypothetical protein
LRDHAVPVGINTYNVVDKIVQHVVLLVLAVVAVDGRQDCDESPEGTIS